MGELVKCKAWSPARFGGHPECYFTLSSDPGCGNEACMVELGGPVGGLYGNLPEVKRIVRPDTKVETAHFAQQPHAGRENHAPQICPECHGAKGYFDHIDQCVQPCSACNGTGQTSAC